MRNTFQAASILIMAASLTLAPQARSDSHGDGAGEGELPEPAELFKRHIEAVGGKQAINAHTSRTVNGKFQIPVMGVVGQLHVVAAAPNKISTTVDLGQFGKSRSGYNGNVGWRMDAMSGNEILTGEALAGMINSADFYSDLNLGKDSSEQETVGVASFGDEDHYRVRLVGERGEETFLYFSTSSGLMSGIGRMDMIAMNKVPTEIRLKDYTEFEGVLSPRLIVTNQNFVESIMQIESMTYDTVDEQSFALPAEIQTIVNDQS
jgi:hypothetical protein